MARSRRHTPIVSWAITASEKRDKQHANRHCRAALRGARSARRERPLVHGQGWAPVDRHPLPQADTQVGHGTP